MSDKRIDDSELHALVDNELDAARRAEVEAWLSENPEAAGRVARYRAQNAGMHVLFDGVLTEKLPPIVASALAGRRTWPRRLAAIAAGLVMLVAGGVAGWVLRGELTSDTAPQIAATSPPIDTQELMVRAAMAHVVNSDDDLRQASAEDAGDTERYLRERLGKEVRVPQLSSLGYRLVGSRVLPDTKGPAAQFVFEDPDGKRITLYVRTEAARGVDITYALADDLSMFYWNDSKQSYALVRALDDEAGRDALLQAAKSVYSQITDPSALAN